MKNIIILSMIVGSVFSNCKAYNLTPAEKAIIYAQCHALRDAPVAPKEVDKGSADVTENNVQVEEDKTDEKKPTGFWNGVKRFFGGKQESAVAVPGDNGATPEAKGEGSKQELAEGQSDDGKLATSSGSAVAPQDGACGSEAEKSTVASWVRGHCPSVRGIVKAGACGIVGGITIIYAGSGMMHQLALASPAAKEFIYENGLYKIAYCAGWGANMTVNIARNVCQFFGGCN